MVRATSAGSREDLQPPLRRQPASTPMRRKSLTGDRRSCGWMAGFARRSIDFIAVTWIDEGHPLSPGGGADLLYDVPLTWRPRDLAARIGRGNRRLLTQLGDRSTSNLWRKSTVTMGRHR